LQHVYDPYAFVRDAYLQRRAYLVSDGKMTDEPLIDPEADNPEAEKTPTTPPSDTQPTSH
jgi:ABC-type transporter lipoprotein component MlaA